MAVQKPLQLVSGVATEVAATEASAGAADEGKIVALNASGQIDPTMLPSGSGPGIGLLYSFVHVAVT